MKTSGRLIGVGAFVIGGLVLFALGLFMIGDRRLLFRKQFDVHATFSELSGLQGGAKVRVGGMDAGEVTAILIPSGPSVPFRVRMRVREDLHAMVRTDSVAMIQNDGLVGNKFVQIGAGSEQAPRVAPGGTIRSREPFDLADLLGRASGAVDGINTTVLQLRQQVKEVLGAVQETTVTTNAVVQAVGDDVEEIAAASRRLSTDASRMVADIRAGRGTIGKLVTDEELYVRATAIARETEATIRNVREASQQARTTMDELRATMKGGNAPVQGLISNLQHTLASTREAMSDLEENSEALKRNFLFRGFFNDRGYYDLNEITAVDYRAGALGRAHRRPIRLWIAADLLFEAAPLARTATTGDTQAEPDEALSSQGLVRIDSAMAELLQYPATSPLIVEGYADGDTRDAQHRRSGARAVQVRDYLITRYRLKPNRIGAMALGRQADGSPRGNTWDGIGLTAWVDERVFPPSR
jgi:phospholipid/cholesterol/gamma-HCH transport system substrate-binding protein